MLSHCIACAILVNILVQYASAGGSVYSSGERLGWRLSHIRKTRINRTPYGKVIEIYVNRQWSRICPDTWTDVEAVLACENLKSLTRVGIPSEINKGSYSGRTYHVFCNTDSISISQCYCVEAVVCDKPNKVAGIYCGPGTGITPMTTTITTVRTPFPSSLRPMTTEPSTPVPTTPTTTTTTTTPSTTTTTTTTTPSTTTTTTTTTPSTTTSTTTTTPSTTTSTTTTTPSTTTSTTTTTPSTTTSTSTTTTRRSTGALPDLQPDAGQVQQSATLVNIAFGSLQCANEEGCLAASARNATQTSRRLLLRFTSSVKNVGVGDFKPPGDRSQWQWHSCHSHYHSMEAFSVYDIINSIGGKVAEGHKSSFCLEDTTCDPGVRRKYTCGRSSDQGISSGCSDDYNSQLDCQWVDVTDLSPGQYYLRIRVNPNRRVTESSYANNAVQCNLAFTRARATVSGCVLRPM